MGTAINTGGPQVRATGTSGTASVKQGGQAQGSLANDLKNLNWAPTHHSPQDANLSSLSTIVSLPDGKLGANLRFKEGDPRIYTSLDQNGKQLPLGQERALTQQEMKALSQGLRSLASQQMYKPPDVATFEELDKNPRIAIDSSTWTPELRSRAAAKEKQFDSFLGNLANRVDRQAAQLSRAQ